LPHALQSPHTVSTPCRSWLPSVQGRPFRPLRAWRAPMSRWTDLLKQKAAEVLAAQEQTPAPPADVPGTPAPEALTEREVLLAEAEANPEGGPVQLVECVRLEAFGREVYMPKWKYDRLVQWGKDCD